MVNRILFFFPVLIVVVGFGRVFKTGDLGYFFLETDIMSPLIVESFSYSTILIEFQNFIATFPIER